MKISKLSFLKKLCYVIIIYVFVCLYQANIIGHSLQLKWMSHQPSEPNSIADKSNKESNISVMINSLNVTTIPGGTYNFNVTSIPGGTDNFSQNLKPETIVRSDNPIPSSLAVEDMDTVRHPTFKIPDLVPNVNRCEMKCSGLEKFVCIINSRASNFAVRTILRNTWANSAIMEANGVKIVFVIGLPPASLNEDRRFMEESIEHCDVIQGNFLDTFNNLTLKSIFALKWISQSCLHTRFIVKTDDDIFINTYELFPFLGQITNYQRSVIGCMFAEQYRPIYRKTDPEWFLNCKYCVDESDFPGQKFFPRYVLGTMYVLSTNLIPELLEEAKITSYLFLEDVFITGILMGKLPNVSYQIRQDIFYFANWGLNGTLQHYQNADEISIYVASVHSYNMLEHLWQLASMRWNLKQKLLH